MNESYVTATVVARIAPVSSHLGDRATIYADGRMEGFIGGSCSRDIIRRYALDALRTGTPRLVRIRPDVSSTTETADLVTVPMRCISEGAVDVYIEPHIPSPQLLLIGFTPVAQALAEIAPGAGFTVESFVAKDETRDAGGLPLDELDRHLECMDDGVRARSAAVVASQGHYDEDALAMILRHDLSYVGLVASRTRARSILASLELQGVPSERLALLRYPAGLAIGARKPPDVAISIFAEIIAGKAQQSPAVENPRTASAFDPVCGMEVDVVESTPALAFDERTYYFCTAHCRSAFASDPARYTAVSST